MRKIGACIAIVALTILVSSPPATAAFSIRIGPYHFVFGSHGHRYHRHVRRHARPARTARQARQARPARQAPPAPAQGVSSALLYPQLALPAVYAFVFSSSDGAAWPFDYRSIFLAGFAKTGTQPTAKPCDQRPDIAAGTVARIRDALEPQGPQLQQLRDLERALAAAEESLAQVCPSEIPAQPLARLELMESQLLRMTAALDSVREPLLAFQRSLNDEQRARFAAMIVAGAGNQGNMGCGSTAKAVDWSIEQIDRAVQPTDAQRDSLGDVKQAFAAAASDLSAHCLAGLPPTAPSRLEEIAANLVVTRQAVASIRAALADFRAKLSDEQQARFDAIKFTGR